MKARTNIFQETIKQFLFFIRAQVQYLQDESAFIALQPVRFSINSFSIPANVAAKRELCRIQTRRTGCQI